MNKSTKKLIAIVLMISMLFTLAPTAAFAAPAESNSELSGLKQYTSMEELIQDAIDELVAQGDMAAVVEADEALVEDVEEASGKSFGEVKSSIAQGLFAEYEQGSLDVAELNLNEGEMYDVMDVLLKERYMTDAVDYQFNTRNGVVTDIDFSLSDGLQAVLGELSSMTEEVTKDEEFQQAVALVAADVVVEEPEPQVSLFSMRAAEEAATPQAFSWCDCSQSHVTTNTAIQFTWEETSTYVVDEEGNPVYSLVYDAENDAITFGPTMQWDAQAVKAEYDCPLCGQHCVVEGDLAPYIKTTDLQDYSVQTGVNAETGEPEYMTYMQFRVAVLGVPVFEEGVENFGVPAKDAEGNDCIASNQDFYDGTNGGALYDVSSLQTKYAFLEMTELNTGKSECLGVANPFWTSKNTATNPLGALKVVLNMEETDPNVPVVFAQYVPQLTQGYAALVYHYEGALLDIANAARETVNVGTAYDANRYITDEYKLLLLHDWLANNAFFDMGSLLKSRDEGQDAEEGGGVGLESLIGMTPFTLLSDAIGYDGGVCLGYAASYSYIVQNAFPDNYFELKDGATGETMKDFVPVDNPEHMVDFVKIRFNSNVAESSVAGGDSGFGDGEARFTEPHFFNAVKVGNNWYYVDACYDDVNSEVISQYRVETEGNISHMFFMCSPETIEEQFEGNCDYIDSLYDGIKYQQPEDPDYQAKVERGEIEAGWDKVEVSNETRYTDTTYEEAWFANAESEIILHEGNWYYVEGLNAYNSMKDMFDEENQDYMDQMKDQMQDQMNDPQYAHELKRRPISANKNLTGTTMTGEGQNATLQEDNYAYGLYHYGYGYFDYGTGGVSEESGLEAVFAKDLEDDRAYRQMYPELSHGLGIYDGDLYFNISNKILRCDLGLIGSDEVPISQVKEYNDVYAVKEDKLFEGMGFTLTDEENAEYSFRYRPLAGLSIHDKVVATQATDQMTGQPATHAADMVPTMFVAVGTNLTESYGDPNYTEEALNYNPNYQRFMDDDKTDGENTNVEFMWCANLTEEMDMVTLLDELVNGETVEVSVAAYCEKDAFTETRTANYGLSDGTTKVVTEKSALKHSYVWNETEQMYVCENCNHCVTERPDGLLGDVNDDGVVNTSDALLVAQYAIALPVEINLSVADVNDDGEINTSDALLVAQRAIGLISF